LLSAMSRDDGDLGDSSILNLVRHELILSPHPFSEAEN